MFRSTVGGGLFILAGGILGCGGGDVSPKTATEPVSNEPSAASETSVIEPTPAVAAAPVDPAQPFGWVGQSGDEPFDVNEFLKSRAAPNDNPAPLYIEALQSLEGNALLNELRVTTQDARQLYAMGRNAQAMTERALESLSPAIAQIDRAQSRPSCVFVNDLGWDASIPYRNGAVAFRYVALYQLYLARAREDRDLAISTVRRALRLSRDLQPRNSPHDSTALERIVLDGIMIFTLDGPQLCFASKTTATSQF